MSMKHVFVGTKMVSLFVFIERKNSAEKSLRNISSVSKFILSGYIVLILEIEKKFTSFTRQLNIYGFKQIRNGPFNGSYFHQNFVRGQRELLFDILRVPIKSEPKPETTSPKSKTKPKKSKESAAPFQSDPDAIPVMPFFPVIMNPGNSNHGGFQDQGYYVFYSPRTNTPIAQYPPQVPMTPRFPDYYHYGMVRSQPEFSSFPYPMDYGMRELECDRSRSESIASTLSSSTHYESVGSSCFALNSSSDSNLSLFSSNNSFPYSNQSLIQSQDDHISKYHQKKGITSNIDDELSTFCDELLNNDMDAMDF